MPLWGVILLIFGGLIGLVLLYFICKFVSIIFLINYVDMDWIDVFKHPNRDDLCYPINKKLFERCMRFNLILIEFLRMSVDASRTTGFFYLRTMYYHFTTIVEE
ncbi:MAG: hypothetical protein G01um101433_663 [Parcubacteria group bacterium Gr01-1014_33]|nr:MAG: hypothetical protein G01um101433_663 [Parcubacteria group bacterium Gr01-1014_33]